jgi:dTMP kinase
MSDEMKWESEIVKEYAEKIKNLSDIPHFIDFEGIEGSGKTTQVKILSRFLRKLGFRTEVVRDPGTTELGEKIRKILKSDIKISPVSELFLFLSARRQLVDEVIKPSLRHGKIVIADRFTASTLAYQGRGRGLIPETLPMLCYIATGGIEPEITFVLDLEPEIGLSRIRERNNTENSSEEGEAKKRRKSKIEFKEDRFEKENIDFHIRVREFYIELSQTQDNVFLIDADRPPLEVFESVLLKLYEFSKEKYGTK